ncbi:hypothetical protein CLOSTASPAR_02959 [[Clostridium] asparagiforme DSM 15981]|uniref:Uncharacterized protein n=1 Tax=[Clostridium] asparagiforme DSM 15981 TaxID=518636 RepID=C0D122_9FIRM|nr:hypothetical protein CLOSTASPAR_02959 [[Clostridium] asparagiforme DSM 15981]
MLINSFFQTKRSFLANTAHNSTVFLFLQTFLTFFLIFRNGSDGGKIGAGSRVKLACRRLLN